MSFSLKTIVNSSSKQTLYSQSVHVLFDLVQKIGVRLAGMCIMGRNLCCDERSAGTYEFYRSGLAENV